VASIFESDKKFLVKEIFNDQNDVRHLLLTVVPNVLHDKRCRNSVSA